MKFIRWVLFGLLLTSISMAQDVVTTTIIAEGSGAAVGIGQEVTVSYKLFNENGTLLKEIPETKPYTFKLGSDEVLSGFSLGIEGMKVQEARKVEIPPALGYGENSPPNIEPNTTLTLEVKLLKFGDTLASPGKDEATMSGKFQNEEYLSKRHARDIGKPAIFEYLIRDFFTKPWRYDDSHRKILSDCLKLAMVLGALMAVYGIGLRKGWLKP